MDFKEINHLLTLARLTLTEEEKTKINKDLAQILDYVGKLSQVDTDKVEPMNGGTTNLENVVREDQQDEGKEQCQETLKKAAFSQKGDYFKVPPIF